MKQRIISLALALLICALPASAVGGVASEADMTDVEDIVDARLAPVTSDALNDGEYAIEVDSSSSMFKVLGATLTVSDAAMTVRLSMKSDAYSYMYAGTAEAAADAPESALSALETGEDGWYFTLPVDALDAGYTCAAYSARKQLWYPRTLVFRSDSLPLEAWKPEAIVTARSLGLEDGTYTCEAGLEGEGKAQIQSPVTLTVEGGECAARVAFSTSKIDYILVNDTRLLPVDTENGATFEVPVALFDRRIGLTVDSTAIQPAVEVPYRIVFFSDTLNRQ